MALSDRLAIVITANGSQAVGEFNRVGRTAGRRAGRAEKGAQKMGEQLTRTGAALLTFGAVALVGLSKLASAAAEQEAAELRLQNTLSNMPQLAGETTDAYLAQADALMQVTVADDAVIVSAQSVLGSLGATGDQIRELTPLVVDYAQKYGIDLPTAAKQVGRAIAGNAGVLQRQIGTLDANAYAADNYGTVLRTLQERVGGFAEQEAQTFNGRLEIMKNRLGEVAEGVGVGVLDAFGDLLGMVDSTSNAFSSLDPNVQSTAGRLLTYASVGLVASGGLSLITGAAIRMRGQLKAAADQALLLPTRLRMLAMSGVAGPAAIGIGMLAAVVAAYAIDQQNAQQRTDAFTEAIHRQAEGAGAGAREVVAAAVANGDLADAAERAGVPLELIADAMLGQGDAARQVEQILGDYIGAEGRATSARQNAGAAAQVVRDAIADQSAALEQANAQLERENQGQEAAGAATQETTAAIEAQRASIEELSAEIDAYLESAFNITSTQDDLLDSFDKLYQSVLENGAAFDGTSTQARANRDAMQGVVSTTAELVQAQYDSGASTSAMNATIQLSRDRLQQAADAGLITADAFTYYSGILDGITPIVSTTTVTPGLPAAEQSTSRYDRILRGIPAYRSTQFVADTANAEAAVRRYLALIDQADNARFTMQASVPGGPQQWTGGPVGGTGPQNRTLHGGEYVLSSDVVNRIQRGRQSRGADMGTSSPSGGGVTVIFQGPVYGADSDELARMVSDRLRKQTREVT